MSGRRGATLTTPYWWLKHLLLVVGMGCVIVGAFATIFFLVDIGFTIYGAMQSGGSITVGDRMDVLQWELFVGIPIAVVFVFCGFLILALFYINWWRQL